MGVLNFYDVASGGDGQGQGVEGEEGGADEDGEAAQHHEASGDPGNWVPGPVGEAVGEGGQAGTPPDAGPEADSGGDEG